MSLERCRLCSAPFYTSYKTQTYCSPWCALVDSRSPFHAHPKKFAFLLAIEDCDNCRLEFSALGQIIYTRCKRHLKIKQPRVRPYRWPFPKVVWDNCPQCRCEFSAHHTRHVFCQDECRQKYYNKHGVGRVPARFRTRLNNRDLNRCFYCNKFAKTLGVDHVVPLALGGLNTYSNLISCCPRCNTKKGCERLPIALERTTLREIARRNACHQLKPTTIATKRQRLKFHPAAEGLPKAPKSPHAHTATPQTKGKLHCVFSRPGPRPNVSAHSAPTCQQIKDYLVKNNLQHQDFAPSTPPPDKANEKALAQAWRERLREEHRDKINRLLNPSVSSDILVNKSKFVRNI